MTKLNPQLTPPYYAVIFTSIRTKQDPFGYADAADRMHQLANEYPAFLGLDSARNDVGITVSYWRDLDTIKQWKNHADHKLAQALGREKWYQAYSVKIAKVEMEYDFEAE
ncbi:antibiotic biosynthesis monooxygenase family protein [Catenovulum maritimum]|uniref:JEMB protein n=1 Tax=Catenovulum maritimum TaxID=1513271 RepID=A0A0J8GTA6_9ALTE|nr:antibiotic biosynthesis monooxygenase [Catenovulum maritimum]KMT64514.1 JEMB protein [Catenovulum maritimum]